jgi:5-methylthioadenosine/S-adenosylhomocysteine deaminase
MRLLIKNVILGKKKVDILIEGEKISKIGKNLNLKANEKIDAKGEKAVIPGLINCHTHSAMILFRGLAEDLPLKDWLEKEIWPKESKLTEDDVYWGTKLAILEMIKSGITTFNEMYWFEEAQIEAVKEMGIRAVIGLVILDFLPIGSKEKVEKLYFKFSRLTTQALNDLITFSIAPHAIYTVSKENLVWAKNFAKKHKLLIHMHLSETENEVKECQRKYKINPVEFLEKIGFLDKNCIFAHSIWLNNKEIEILEKRGCNLVYNPTSNMKLVSGIFPWVKIKERKINVCLGTDGPASNNSLNLFSEMKIGVLLQKIENKDPRVISTKEIFQMATKNGAKALRINTGEIKVGKLADLVLINLNKIEMFPNYDLISNLIYSDSKNCVSDVICNGKILMRDGEIKKEGEILSKGRQVLKKFFKSIK